MCSCGCPPLATLNKKPEGREWTIQLLGTEEEERVENGCGECIERGVEVRISSPVLKKNAGERV